jgi:hypothetical protein
MNPATYLATASAAAAHQLPVTAEELEKRFSYVIKNGLYLPAIGGAVQDLVIEHNRNSRIDRDWAKTQADQVVAIVHIACIPRQRLWYCRVADLHRKVDVIGIVVQRTRIVDVELVETDHVMRPDAPYLSRSGVRGPMNGSSLKPAEPCWSWGC